MDPSTETVQILVQGGAIGILLVFFGVFYRLGMKMMEYAKELLDNHLNHIASEISNLHGSIDKQTDTTIAALALFEGTRQRIERFIDKPKSVDKRRSKTVD